MSILTRARDTAHDLEQVDLNALRARIVDAVETALDGSEKLRSRASDAIDDAPSASEVATRVRHPRAWELAGSAAATAVPIAASALRRRASRRTALRAARSAPMLAARTHPVLLGFAAVGGVATGMALVRRMRAKAERESMDELATRDGLEEQESRMDAEGPLPGASAPKPTSARRFVRASDANGSGSAAHEPSQL